VACLGEPVLLRPGGVARAEIERVLGRKLGVAATPEAPRAPGMLSSHYAPKARLRLNAQSPRPGEALLAFGPDAPAADRLTLNLSPRGDLIEAAANLFSHLRALDASGASTIAVMKVPHEGLGEAIIDRLERAAAPRRGARA
jgi:L-threonylcarbamoyladenylate synthase